ncbi:YfiR/HmsC family protein [Agaribacterium sp. ZY112]|uniref:YfiR/HmsC family protein n=1 Tax=Agaribacterium sp. ZY112 TaxID=3233574 RepID=UPI00352333F5
MPRQLTYPFFASSTRSLWLAGCILLCLLISTSVYASSSSAELQTLKTALVYKILEQIDWPDNSKKLKLAHIALSEDEIRILERLEGKKVNGRSIELKELKDLNQSQGQHALILGSEYNNKLAGISVDMQKQGVLLITDAAQQSNLIMINFYYPEDGRVNFELNRYQIISAGLGLSNDVLLLGGSEVDIAQALTELNHTLRRQLKDIETDRKQLTTLKQEMKSSLSLLKSQQQKVKDTELRFNTLKSEHQALLSSLEDSRSQLQNNNNILNNQRSELADKESSIATLNKLIAENKAMLTEQTERLEQQRQSLSMQEEELDSQLTELKTQGSTIRRQYILLISAGFALMLIAISFFALYRSNIARRLAYAKLEQNKIEIEHTLEQLKQAQTQLVQSEKMAALGSLVAGVAHEINTPLGVGVTAASHLADSVDSFKKLYSEGALKRSDFDNFIEQNSDACELLQKNLNRASTLIKNFKQVAADQSSEERRIFNLHDYCKETWDTLYHHTKQKHIKLLLNIKFDLELDSYPGLFSQIFTNLFMNSAIHAFADKTDAEISITATLSNNAIEIHYRDNGSGISEQAREKIFDPFFTTKRAQGGTGLGAHICFNLVQKLGGEIKCLAAQQGAHFEIHLPLKAPDLSSKIS